MSRDTSSRETSVRPAPGGAVVRSVAARAAAFGLACVAMVVLLRAVGVEYGAGVVVVGAVALALWVALDIRRERRDAAAAPRA
jgi:hypothetical protein